MAGKVLVVEDDDTIRRLVRAVLAEHHVAETGDGAAALALARRERPDAVLLDIGLPNVDGLAVLAQLKADPMLSDVPVLMITAWDDADLVAKALHAGAHDYLRKPFAPADLSARVAAALRVKAATDSLARAHVELTELAHLDELTGLSNRRRTEELLQAAIRRGGTVSVVLADLDHFSAINNDLGHEAGDDALEGAARRLRERLRGSDEVGRWGGEEFLVVLTDTPLGGAGALAEDLRTALMARPVGGLDVTASFGVAQHDGAETAAALVARADAALYEAKAGDRNAVRLGYSSGSSSSRAIAATGMGTQSGRLLSS